MTLNTWRTHSTCKDSFFETEIHHFDFTANHLLTDIMLHITRKYRNLTQDDNFRSLVRLHPHSTKAERSIKSYLEEQLLWDNQLKTAFAHKKLMYILTEKCLKTHNLCNANYIAWAMVFLTMRSTLSAAFSLPSASMYFLSIFPIWILKNPETD